MDSGKSRIAVIVSDVYSYPSVNLILVALSWNVCTEKHAYKSRKLNENVRSSHYSQLRMREGGLNEKARKENALPSSAAERSTKVQQSNKSMSERIQNLVF